MDTTTTADRIEKEIVIKAPRSRVWRAISEAQEFGAWFKVDLTGVTFRPGESAVGKMTYPGYEGHPFEILVDRIEPERLFSFRWHPYAVEPNHDYSNEPMTLIEFVLEDIESGTKLTVTESGFDRIPLSRRVEAFRMNSEGWAIQVQNVAEYVSAHP